MGTANRHLAMGKEDNGNGENKEEVLSPTPPPGAGAEVSRGRLRQKEGARSQKRDICQSSFYAFYTVPSPGC